MTSGMGPAMGTTTQQTISRPTRGPTTTLLSTRGWSRRVVPACSAGTTFESGDNNCVMPYTPLIPNHRSRFGFSVAGPLTNIKVMGHKTYFFVNYEGFRYPNVGTFERSYPT